MRFTSARIVSTSVTSMPMPALPPGAARSITWKKRRVPATITGRRASNTSPAARTRAASSCDAESRISQIARDRVDAVARFHGAGVGGVHPGEPPARVACPHRRGKRLEKPSDRVDVAAQLLMVGGERGELALRAGQVLDAQHRAPRDGATLRRDMALVQGGQRQREALALAAQCLDRLLHLPRLVGLQPCAEGEHAARHGGARHQRRIAGDVRLVGPGGPHHDHLRLGMQQRDRAVALLAQVVDLALARHQRLPRARAGAQQRDRRHHAEQDDAEGERQRGQLMPVERREGIEVIRKRLPRCLGARIVRRGHGRQNGTRKMESPAPRKRLSAPCPDRVRHVRAPARHRFGPRPKTLGRRRHAARESDFTLNRTRVVRVQTVNAAAAPARPIGKYPDG